MKSRGPLGYSLTEITTAKGSGSEKLIMKDIMQLLEEPGATIAIVGATENPSKYGFVIYKDLKLKGLTVYPVNPNRSSVDGDKVFKRLEDIPQRPTIVNIVVPPEVTSDILQQCLNLGLTNVWLQPGAESPAVMTFLQENNFNYLANACIMVASRLKA